MLRRNRFAHKGDFGHVFILAGSTRFSGAAALCSNAAIRSGAGLVTLGIPKGINSGIIKIKPKEVMTLPLPETKDGSLSLPAFALIQKFAKNADVLAIGPGLTQDKSTQTLICKVIAVILKPMVIDADGLNALVNHLDILRKTKNDRRATILTPHPGEMAKLLKINVKQVQGDRKNIARKFAKKHKITLVLKGHNTVVADSLGKVFVNKTGNPGMATAGSGDVLTGMIAAFLGQGLNAFEASIYGVYLHGLAGDLAAGEKTQNCLIASDIIDWIPEATKASS
ncbi:MAG: NAD(P)H-hydrate dehydratase [Candidatus Omnitrophica bacterium]|nr:NAD(P)H-hydrate dehydratase [Candidatus Omnitrophota bacterium]